MDDFTNVSHEDTVQLHVDTPLAAFQIDNNGWFLPHEVAFELITLFFDNIQPWLPMLHRPHFFQTYVQVDGQCHRIRNRQELGDPEAVLVNCMFALAARFSKSSFFAAIDPVARGDIFADRAAALQDPLLKVVEEPPVDLVKGCALLAFYTLTAGRAGPGALLTSLCVRFAYDLGLDAIDDADGSNDGEMQSSIQMDDADVWVQREGLRRLWWVIYELDCFVATLSCQPFGIERGGIKVFLPGSDYYWFNKIPIRSSCLIQDPGDVWKSLQCSPNQSPRAWYLVTNYLKSCFADAARQPSRNTTEARAALENALACHKLALPAKFHLGTLSVDENAIGDGNWIISTHFMILSCETLLERMKRSGNSSEAFPDTKGDTMVYQKYFYSRLVRIAQIWPPEYIPLNSPFIGCCVVNPWDAIQAGQRGKGDKFQTYELSKLILGHYSRFWRMGTSLLRLLTILHESRDLEMFCSGSKEREILKRYSILSPGSALKTRRSMASRLGTQLSHDDFIEIPRPIGTLPSPSVANLESPGDFAWSMLWDNLQDFAVDLSDPTLSGYTF